MGQTHVTAGQALKDPFLICFSGISPANWISWGSILSKRTHFNILSKYFNSFFLNPSSVVGNYICICVLLIFVFVSTFLWINSSPFFSLPAEHNEQRSQSNQWSSLNVKSALYHWFTQLLKQTAFHHWCIDSPNFLNHQLVIIDSLICWRRRRKKQLYIIDSPIF